MLRLGDSLPQLGRVEQGGVGLGGDALGRLGRDHADLRLGLRERPLDVEPPLQQSAVVERPTRLVRAEQVAEHLGVEAGPHARQRPSRRGSAEKSLRKAEAYDCPDYDRQ